MKRKVIIIGGGPAGLSCAIYLKRYGFDPLLIEGKLIGGDVNITSRVDNYLGFYNEPGKDLTNKFREHIKALKIEVVNDHIINVTRNKDMSFLLIGENNKYETTYLVIATGRVSKKLEIPSEKNFIGRGISYCATCDGPLTKDKDVVVIGGGNSAFEESLFLARFAHKVTILIRNKSKADMFLQEEVKNTPNIEISYGEEVKEFVGDNILKEVVTNKRRIPANFAFIYIGLNPSSSCLKDINVLLDNGHILVDKGMRTSVYNLYACGDIIKKTLYQIISSAYEGSEAAFSIYQDDKKKLK